MQQTAWCSIVSLPKEMLRAYRGSLCNFCSFFRGDAVVVVAPDEPRRKGLHGVYIKRDFNRQSCFMGTDVAKRKAARFLEEERPGRRDL